jgi:hypothetical protein
VEDGLKALGVPLIGHLEVGDQRAEPAQSEKPVTIDTTPPEIHLFGPREGDRTNDRHPQLTMRITDDNGSGVDLDHSSVSAQVDGHAIPVKVSVHGQFLHIDTDDLPPGHVAISVDAFDKAGNETRKDWTFIVAEAPQPGQGGGEARLSVGHDAAGVLMPGDALTVTATGPAGGQAALDLGDWRNNLPMAEDADHPGTYRARVPVGDLTADKTVTPRVRLRTAGGQTLQADATTAVSVSRRRDLAPVLISPTAHQKVGPQVIVEGDTQPLAQVTITITWHGTLLKILAQEGQVAQTQVTADARGHFKTDPIPLQVASALPVKDVTFTASVVATNAHGKTSDPVLVDFSQ